MPYTRSYYRPGTPELTEALIHAHDHHGRCVAMLEEVRDDTKRGFEFETKEGRTLTLEAGSREAAVFRLGLQMALEVFGEFPIALEGRSTMDELERVTGFTMGREDDE